MKRAPRTREVHRVRVEFLTSSSNQDGFHRSLHGLMEEGIRRGFVLDYSVRVDERLHAYFPRDEGRTP